MQGTMPPIEKIYEAYSAIADGRVKVSGQTAVVESSDGTKSYSVKWDGDVYASNDNASYWQGYPGYPVIAVLMLTGKLKYSKNIAGLFKSINWKQINRFYKNNYGEAVDSVLLKLVESGVDIDKIREETQTVYEELRQIPLIIKRSLSKK